MKRYKTLIIKALILSMTCMLVSCGSRDRNKEAVVKVYYPDSSYTTLLSREVKSVSGNTLDTVLGWLGSTGANGSGTVSDNVVIVDHSNDNGKVTISLDKAYKKLNPTEEVLTRAAIVETLTQFEDIISVRFMVDGAELTDSKNETIGEMTKDSFITSTGEELNFYARANVTLYFTDVDGTSLKRYDESMVYATNLSMEKFVLETLLKGPQAVGENNAYPTLPPDATLLNVTVKDRIAYANFDPAIREEPYKVSEEVALYSIVNTLAALPGVDQVQISVDGSTEGVFLDHMPLDALYERNDNIIE